MKKALKKYGLFFGAHSNLQSLFINSRKHLLLIHAAIPVGLDHREPGPWPAILLIQLVKFDEAR